MSHILWYVPKSREALLIVTIFESSESLVLTWFMLTRSRLSSLILILLHWPIHAILISLHTIRSILSLILSTLSNPTLFFYVGGLMLYVRCMMISMLSSPHWLFCITCFKHTIIHILMQTYVDCVYMLVRCTYISAWCDFLLVKCICDYVSLWFIWV